MEDKLHVPGPSLEAYVETRFNLLILAAEKLEAALLERIAAHAHLDEQVHAGIKEQFAHVAELTKMTQSLSQRAVDKAEATQTAHNNAANEWRGTLNDFKATLVSKQEFDRLNSDFAAYKLEQSRLQSLIAGEKVGSREKTDDSKSLIALAVSIASALIVGYSVLKPSTPVTQQSAPQVIYVPAPAGALIPSAPSAPTR